MSGLYLGALYSVAIYTNIPLRESLVPEIKNWLFKKRIQMYMLASSVSEAFHDKKARTLHITTLVTYTVPVALL